MWWALSKTNKTKIYLGMAQIKVWEGCSKTRRPNVLSQSTASTRRYQKRALKSSLHVKNAGPVGECTRWRTVLLCPANAITGSTCSICNTGVLLAIIISPSGLQTRLLVWLAGVCHVRKQNSLKHRGFFFSPAFAKAGKVRKKQAFGAFSFLTWRAPANQSHAQVLAPS